MSTKNEEIAILQNATRRMSRSALLMQTLIAKHAGMGAAEAEVIDYLIESGSTTPGSLAEMTRLRKSTLSAILQRLEKRQYVIRNEDANDKRKAIISANFQILGQKIRSFYIAHGKSFDELVKNYTSEQRTFLIAHYQRMTALYESQIEKLQSLETN